MNLSSFSYFLLFGIFTSCGERTESNEGYSDLNAVSEDPDRVKVTTHLQKNNGNLLADSLKQVAKRSFDFNDRSEENSLSQHTFLAKELVNRIELLAAASSEEQRAVQSRLDDLINSLVLLKRSDELNGIHHEDHLFLDSSYTTRIKELETVWREQPNYGVRIDAALSKHGLLNCEHVPQLFQQWMATSENN